MGCLGLNGVQLRNDELPLTEMWSESTEEMSPFPLNKLLVKLKTNKPANLKQARIYWCWRSLFEISWTAKWSKQERKSILNILWKDWCWSWAPIFWPPNENNWLIRKDSYLGKIEGRRNGDNSGWADWMECFSEILLLFLWSSRCFHALMQILFIHAWRIPWTEEPGRFHSVTESWTWLNWLTIPTYDN